MQFVKTIFIARQPVCVRMPCNVGERFLHDTVQGTSGEFVEAIDVAIKREPHADPIASLKAFHEPFEGSLQAKIIETGGTEISGDAANESAIASI